MLEKLYKIEKPNIDKIEISDIGYEALISKELQSAIKKTASPEYLNWKDLKYKNWVPDHFKNHREKFWFLVKLHRKTNSLKTPIKDSKNNHFFWQKLVHYEEMLHEITLDMSRYLLDIPDASPSDYKKYQAQGILEEAIASSQLEGAHATRKAAKQMIEEKREPKTPDERMIYNNFITMKAIQEKFKNEKLSEDILFDLHRMLMVGTDTLKESEQGRLRQDSDKIVIVKGDDPAVISYVAPPIKFVEKEIKELIAFANDESNEEAFIHPVIKAIMLHFWIGLLHPFVDGNGRLARGLFYWYLLRKGYWAFAFLPISVAIKSAPAKYGEAYILSEQDDNDLTYFIDYHISKINQAIESFRKFFKQKSVESRKINKILYEHQNLNRRQTEALAVMIKNPEKIFTLTIYTNVNNITKATAIKDLKILLNLGFVEAEKRGRNVFYTATKKAGSIF